MSKNVLIIDHDPLIRNLIANLVVLRQMEPYQAASRDEAEDLLKKHSYDLILLDLMLPEENGFRVLEHIQQKFPNQAQHTVLLTHADPKFVANLPPEGWCAVLVKPFSIAEFYRIMDLCLGGEHIAGFCYN